MILDCEVCWLWVTLGRSIQKGAQLEDLGAFRLEDP